MRSANPLRLRGAKCSNGLWQRLGCIRYRAKKTEYRKKSRAVRKEMFTRRRTTWTDDI